MNLKRQITKKKQAKVRNRQFVEKIMKTTNE